MAQITDLQTYRAFWRDEIAGRNNALQGFTELDNNEALDTIKGIGLTSPFMVLLPSEWRTTDLRTHNVQRSIQWGFFILKAATDKQDLNEVKTIQNDCHQIAEEIVARLAELNEVKEFFGKYHATDTDYQPIGMLFGGNHFGVQCFGSFITRDAIKHDATKWT
jgi:hypothetical protein